MKARSAPAPRRAKPSWRRPPIWPLIRIPARRACVTDKTRVVFLANPNNPTGTFSTREEIARLHAALPGNVLLVIDQAYAEYLAPEDDDGAMDLARNAANVVVTRTFSKIFGL